MKKKSTVKKIKENLWNECKRVTRNRYRVGDQAWLCFTCDKLIVVGSDAHTGHFIPSGACGALLRYDLRNLRVQCYHCNINLGGNGAEYYRRMVKEVGKKAVEQLFIDKQKTVKADIIFYSNLLEQYKNL